MDHKNKNFGYPPGKRMTSSVWKYFAFELAKDGKVIDSTKVHCLKCYEIISYHSATTSMDRHLITAHRISSNSEETSASPAKVQKQLEFTVRHQPESRRYHQCHLENDRQRYASFFLR